MKPLAIVVTFVALAAALAWTTAASPSRMCGSRDSVVERLTADGERLWFSYHPQYAAHRVEYWRGESTLTRIAPAGVAGWCILGGGDELAIYP